MFRLKRPFKKQNNSVIPGFGLSMGITITMLSFIVLIPLFSVFLILTDYSFSEFWKVVTDKQTVAAYRVSLSCSAIAAVINVVFGTLLAWVLTRYRFPLRRVLDGLIELPFALHTAVAGIALTTLYSEDGWIGRLCSKEKSMSIEIKKNQCIGCGRCCKVCPGSLIWLKIGKVEILHRLMAEREQGITIDVAYRYFKTDALSRELGLKHAVIIPVSATEGDNVTVHSDKMKWYHGETLLNHLETVNISNGAPEPGFYMPVQRVCRPNHSFRGFQ